MYSKEWPWLQQYGYQHKSRLLKAVRVTDIVLGAEDGRTGTFMIGNDRFQAALLDLPCVLESYKTYDDNVLIKTADVGQVSAPFAITPSLCKSLSWKRHIVFESKLGLRV